MCKYADKDDCRAMSKDNELEIYKQRYETFRYLDRLRWQLIQLAVTIFTATALVVRATSGAIEWWFTLALSLALISIAASMQKISQGLRRNQTVLAKAAKSIGDDGIPDTGNPWKSVFHWIAIAIGCTGLIFLITTIKSIL